MSNSKKIMVTTAYVECPMFPTTIVGRSTGGLTVYARYRSGCLTVRVDPRDPAPFKGAWGLQIHESIIGESDDGIMTYDELKTLTCNQVEWPDQLNRRLPDEVDEFSH